MSYSLSRSMAESVRYIKERYGEMMYCREDMAGAIRALWPLGGNLSSAACASHLSVIRETLRRSGIQDFEDKYLQIRRMIDHRADIDAIIACIPPGVRARNDMMEKFKTDILSLFDDLYYTPEDYMRRLVNRLADADIVPGECGSLRLSILKQFLRQGVNTTSLTSFYINEVARQEFDQLHPNGRATKRQKEQFVLERLDDSIFDLAFSSADRRKESPEIVNLADRLGSGRFNTMGGTKKFLYLFAIAFDMTVYTGGENETFDRSRDVVQNLFNDYYNNNLFRDLVRMYDTKGLETMPSGAGINCKNFVEVAYLYVLKRTDISAEKKYRLAERIIGECVRIGKGKGQSDIDSSPGFSVFCRNRAVDMIERLKDLPVGSMNDCAAAVAEEICSFCRNTSKEMISLESDQRRAFANYKNLVVAIQEEIGEEDINSVLMPASGSKCWVYQFDTEECCSDPEKAETSLNRLAEEMASKDLFTLNDANKISRVRLMIVYFYYFCQTNRGVDLPFSRIYENYVTRLDSILEDSNYQTFSEKVFLDMMLVALAYITVVRHSPER